MASSEALLSISNDFSQIKKARRFAERHLTAWGLELVADVVVLCVSELVTNAMLHGGRGIELVLHLDGTLVRVEVKDASSSRPLVRGYSATATTGRGMVIVEALATNWGSERLGTGKVVWFELETDASDVEPYSAAN